MIYALFWTRKHLTPLVGPGAYLSIWVHLVLVRPRSCHSPPYLHTCLSRYLMSRYFGISVSRNLDMLVHPCILYISRGSALSACPAITPPTCWDHISVSLHQCISESETPALTPSPSARRKRKLQKAKKPTDFWALYVFSSLISSA